MGRSLKIAKRGRGRPPLRERRPFRINLPLREGTHVLRSSLSQGITVTEFFRRLVERDLSESQQNLRLLKQSADNRKETL